MTDNATASRAPWWICLFAIPVVLALGVNVWTHLMGPVGSGYRRAGRVSLEVAVPSRPLAAAGVRPGDVLRAVDGQPLESILDWDLARENFELGKPFALDVLRGDQTLRLNVVLTQRSVSVWDAKNYVATIAVDGALLICLTLALLLVIKRPDDPNARCAAWLLGSIAAVTPPLTGEVAIVRQLPAPIGFLAVGGILLSFTSPAAWFCFFAMFPRRVITRTWQWTLALVPIAVLATFFSLWLIRFVYAPDATRGPTSFAAFLLYAAVGFALEIAGLAILFSNFRRLQDQTDRRKVGVLLVGTAIGLPAAFAANVPSQIAGQNIVLGNIVAVAGSLLFLLWPLSFTYAVLRHRLFDVGVIVRRGLQYALARGAVLWATPAMIALFLLDVAVHEGDIGAVAIGNFFAHTARAWIYVVAGIMALVTQRKRGVWLEQIDRHFFRERYNAQQILRQVAEELRHASSIEQVAARVVTRIDAALHPEFTALLVRASNETTYHALACAPAGSAPPLVDADSKLIGLIRLLGKPLQISTSESGWLHRQLPHEETAFLRRAKIDLLVPVSLSAFGREALLTLGQKKSEEPYSAEDQELLLAIASGLALLLERPATVVTNDGLEECPVCFTCYDSGVGRCAQDDSRLIPSAVPRVLTGRYRLDRRLGRGGMGTVYAALDTTLERQVALKLVREDLVSSAEAAERFRREAKAAAAITHPNLVTLYDFAVDGGHRAFLVMELLTGSTLRERLRTNGRLPATVALDVVRGLAGALTIAHERGLIHRDLKPENIFLTTDGQRELPKILDFGLAKFLGSSEAVTRATLETGRGVVVGTTAYMSPEQLQGKPASVQWDLWALAVIVYEMLIGAHPFGDRHSVAALQNAILVGAATPVASHIADAPAAWQPLLAESLSVDASRRAHSAGEFLARCERALIGG